MAIRSNAGMKGDAGRYRQVEEYKDHFDKVFRSIPMEPKFGKVYVTELHEIILAVFTFGNYVRGVERIRFLDAITAFRGSHGDIPDLKFAYATSDISLVTNRDEIAKAGLEDGVIQHSGQYYENRMAKSFVLSTANTDRSIPVTIGLCHPKGHTLTPGVDYVTLVTVNEEMPLYVQPEALFLGEKFDSVKDDILKCAERMMLKEQEEMEE